jgi:hypothetical protein
MKYRASARRIFSRFNVCGGHCSLSLRLYFGEHLLASVARHEREQFLVNVFIPIYRKEGRDEGKNDS